VKITPTTMQDTYFDHEDHVPAHLDGPHIHQLAEQNRFAEIDLTALAGVLVHQRPRCAGRPRGSLRALPAPPALQLHAAHDPRPEDPRADHRGDQDQHPLHLHGNHYSEIARYGRLLTMADGTTLAPRKRFTTLSVPGQTVDAIFEWTGEKLGWDIYGTPADGMPEP
jgi:manganese oxidase